MSMRQTGAIGVALWLLSGLIPGPASGGSSSSPAAEHGPQVVAAEMFTHARFAGMLVGQTELVEGVRLSDGRAVDLVLERFEVRSADARHVIVGADGVEREAPAPDVVLLRGTIAGEADSLVVIGVGRHSVNGIVQRAGGLDLISTGRDGGERLAGVVSAATLRPDLPASFCGVSGRAAAPAFPQRVRLRADGGPRVTGDRPGAEGEVPAASTQLLRRRVRIAVETDHEYLADVFDNGPARAGEYCEQIVGVVSEIYAKEVGTRLELAYTRLWAADNDPYESTGSLERFEELRARWSTVETGVDRDMVHMLSGLFDPSGAIGWGDLGGICHTTDPEDPSVQRGYALSTRIVGAFSDPFTDRSPENFDVYLFAHETGHVFGSVHTHEYDTPIDDCGLVGNGAPCRVGTIMSYCAFCEGGQVRPEFIRLAFAPEVRAVIEQTLAGVPCELSSGVLITGIGGAPPVVAPGVVVPVAAFVDPRDDAVAGVSVVTRSADGGERRTPLVDLGPSGWIGAIEAGPCGRVTSYWFEAEGVSIVGDVFPRSPDAARSMITGTVRPLVAEDFGVDGEPQPAGWTVTGSVSVGAWGVAVPLALEPDDIFAGSVPGGDADGSGRAAMTGPAAAGFGGVVTGRPVRDGRTTLTSPRIDLEGADAAVLTYDRWFFDRNAFGTSSPLDQLIVEASADDGATWTILERLGATPDEGMGGWVRAAFDLGGTLPLTGGVRVRFTAVEDSGAGGLDEVHELEAAIDAFEIASAACPDGGACSPADVAEPLGTLNLFDILAYFDAFVNQDASADLFLDGMVNIFDITVFFERFTEGC